MKAGPYLRFFYSIDSKEYEKEYLKSLGIFPYDDDEYWNTYFHYEQDSVAYFVFGVDKFALHICSDTTCFINGKKYYYGEESMRNNPNYIKNALPGLAGKQYFSGSFEFHLMEIDESIDFYDRLSYYVLFDTRWVDKEDSDTESVLDTVIFNGRIEIYAQKDVYFRNYIMSQ